MASIIPNEDEIWLQSLQAMGEELRENLVMLSGNRTEISNIFNEWLENRNVLIRRLLSTCDELKVARRKCNKATLSTSQVSLVGGIVLVGGLFATSAVSLPLMAFGGVVSAIGSVGQVSASAGEAIKSHSLLKKCEEDIKSDAECLDRLLKSIGQYLYRIQCFDIIIRDQKETRKAKGYIETAYYGIRFGKSLTDYVRSLKQMEVVLENAQKTVSLYQKLSAFIKGTRVYQAIFRTTAKEVTTQAAGAGAKMMGKKVFAVLGVVMDISNIIMAQQELKGDSTPSAVRELEKTVDRLILEKAQIQEIFFLTCQ